MVIFSACTLTLLATPAIAVEINGTVREASGNTATIVTESNLVPAVGDKVEVFFKMAGADIDISVGTGRVTEVSADSIKVSIEQTTGEVTRDQLVRIHSDDPTTRAVSPVEATPARRHPAFEFDTDRPGNDYRNFQLSAADPGLCATQCAQESECRAWTFVVPRCWLKSSVPEPVRGATFAVSGIMQAPAGAESPGFEYDIDRPGGDYRSLVLSAADAQLCATQCERESECRAWTYNVPHCWLKNSVPAPVTGNTFTVSGVKQP
jgi:hypothetical protein